MNARILAMQSKTDSRRIEAASLKKPTCLTSAEGKRAFVRPLTQLAAPSIPAKELIA